MKTKVIIAVSILIIATGCISKRNSLQCSIYQSNIDLTHKLFTHLVSGEHHHFLFGAVEENQLDYRTSEITIDRSIVGDEKNWKSFSKNIPGKCQAVSQTEKYIYLISRQQYHQSQDPKYSKHKLYRISKENGTITELYKWDEGNLSFNGLYFYSETEGYVFVYSHNSNLEAIIQTNDSGKEWFKLDTKVITSNPIYLPNNLHFFSKKHQIASIDKTGNTIDFIELTLNVTDFSVEENGDYWLLGKEENKTILQRYANGKTTDVHTFSDVADISPDQLYKYNELIVVIASQIDENMLGGFGGTKPLMFVSKDNGLTWNNHQLDEAFYLKPISFYKDERMTAYLGNGKILTCEF